MIEAKVCCKECKFNHIESGDLDDGAFVERAQSIAHFHADDTKHEVEFLRHEHSPRVITPREFPPGPGLRENVHALNPLNDSFV